MLRRHSAFIGTLPCADPPQAHQRPAKCKVSSGSLILPSSIPTVLVQALSRATQEVSLLLSTANAVSGVFMTGAQYFVLIGWRQKLEQRQNNNTNNNNNCKKQQQQQQELLVSI
ncbi:unnamed protein product [Polarella glacialis]|uniref:Uncharacterized protein n=1 Tax=Polarella glacialis TaxID=89957 RepID=A0A813HYB4_POLGL|nr:unnamed protein product [Polarella glacialis]CAE8652394.1 unnamed protein product [Polarella glacialis]